MCALQLLGHLWLNEKMGYLVEGTVKTSDILLLQQGALPTHCTEVGNFKFS